jgi:hypothetical protein
MAAEVETLERIALELEPLARVDTGVLGDDELCALTSAAEQVGRLLDSVRVTTAGEIEERSRIELGPEGLARRSGFTRGRFLLERLTRIGSSEASRRIRLGGLLSPRRALTGEPLASKLPEVAAAVSAGKVSLDAADGIVRTLEQARRTADPEQLAAAESTLVAKAASEPVDCVLDLARVLRDRLDPDGVLPREEETRVRRGIRLGRERNGVTPISGGLEPLTAALLKSAFSEANAPGVQPRFLSPQDELEGTETTTGNDGSRVVKVRDIRTRDQRRHDVFTGLLKAGIRNTGFETGQLRSTADVTVVIRLSDLESRSGPGWLEGVVEPVSAATVEMLACDALFRKIVLGNDGEVLSLGRTQYPFSAAQRRALLVRDGGCVWEGCSAPAGWCDVHHVVEYNSHGAKGTTDIDNAVLLCAEHHQFLHHSEWQLRIHHGRPEVVAPAALDPHQKWRRVTKSRLQLPDTG